MLCIKGILIFVYSLRDGILSHIYRYGQWRLLLALSCLLLKHFHVVVGKLLNVFLYNVILIVHMRMIILEIIDHILPYNPRKLYQQVD